jgi:hypothetical protein
LATLLLTGRPCRAEIIFNNYPGDAGNHGYVGAYAPNSLAAKFIMGSQPYSLDSATVYPINTSAAGSLTSNAILLLYSNDTVKNQPLASLGVTMVLTGGATNPVTISAGQGLVPLAFTPTAPVTLQPNTAYWFALSFDNQTAFNLGEAADATFPTGIAAARASSRSFDGGLTWNAADGGASWPMTVNGTLSVPEPGSLTLFGLAAIGWVRYWRRRWGAGALSVVAIMLVVAGQGSAQPDFVWSPANGSSGAFEDVSNWRFLVNGMPTHPPGATDTALFTAIPLMSLVTFCSDWRVSQLAVSGDDGPFTVSVATNGHRLTVDGLVMSGAAFATLQLSDGAITNNCGVTIANTNTTVFLDHFNVPANSTGRAGGFLYIANQC